MLICSLSNYDGSTTELISILCQVGVDFKDIKFTGSTFGDEIIFKCTETQLKKAKMLNQKFNKTDYLPIPDKPKMKWHSIAIQNSRIHEITHKLEALEDLGAQNVMSISSNDEYAIYFKCSDETMNKLKKAFSDESHLIN